MDSPHGRTLGRFARTLWVTCDYIEPLLSLARPRHLAGDIKSFTADRRCRESNRRGSTFYGQHHHPRSPTRRRSKKGELKVGEQSLSVELLPQQEDLGRSKGGFSTKIHIQAEGMGKPRQLVLTPGQCSDVKGFDLLNNALKVKRISRGKPKQRPHYLVGDKGYDAQRIRRTLRHQHTTPIIPKRKHAKHKPRFNRRLYP